MKTIYYVYVDDYEAEAMFSASGELLDFWSCNDGCWRGEYFNPFMKAAGIEVLRGPPEMEIAAFNYCKDAWGE